MENESIKLPRGLCWIFTGLFVWLLALPALIQNGQAIWEDGWVPAAEFFQPSAPTFVEHRQNWESRLETAAFVRPVRQWTQFVLTTVFREGNRKVVIGKDGWLFYRPAIDSIIGYGPLKPEPDSVAKDPNREPWQGPKDIIIEFNRQLEEFGVELVLVPIPVKPTIYPEKLGVDVDAPLRHPDAERFYGELVSKGIRVIEQSAEYWRAKANSQLFLERDTHWTSSGAVFGAALVATGIDSIERVSGLDWRSELEGPSDLELLLELPISNARSSFQGSGFSVPNLSVLDIHDKTAPFVLLGDSFANIYSKPALPVLPSGLGFPEYLASQLETNLDTIAQNGQGSTGVRRTLANRPGSAQMMRKKKLVIWAIAERDLFLSESVARETGVVWERVKFNDAAPTPELSDDTIVVETELVERAAIQNPKTTPYENALFAAKYRVVEVKTGEYGENEIFVYHWAFRDRELQPASELSVGDRRLLTLVPFEQMKELQSERKLELDGFTPLPWFWADDMKMTE